MTEGEATPQPGPDPGLGPGLGPDLSVVLVSAGGWRNLRLALAALAAQTVADRIEVLAVAPDEPGPEAERLARRLHGLRAFRVQAVANVDEEAGRVALEARAPVVASLEDHAFPEPEWAEAILRPFADDPSCVAAGSALTAANPGSRIGTGNMLVAFAPWSEATPEGPIAWLQLHNIAYRRLALAALAAEVEGEGGLASLFNRESDVVRRLRARGALRFAPQARIRHLNPSRLGVVAGLRVAAGRLDASRRAQDEGWGRARRLVYALGAPLIPLVRYARLRREAKRRPWFREGRDGPGMLAVLLFDALGQAIGFVAGPGDARARLARAEHDRYAHLARADARAFGPP